MRRFLMAAMVLVAGCSDANVGRSTESGFRAEVAVLRVTSASGELQTWVGAPASGDVESGGDPVVTLSEDAVYKMTVEVHGSEPRAGEEFEWFPRWLQQGPFDVRMLLEGWVGDGTGSGAIVMLEAEVDVDGCAGESELSVPLVFELFTTRSVSVEPAADVAVVVNVMCGRG